jgi:hypothetical protein
MPTEFDACDRIAGFPLASILSVDAHPLRLGSRCAAVRRVAGRDRGSLVTLAAVAPLGSSRSCARCSCIMVSLIKCAPRNIRATLASSIPLTRSMDARTGSLPELASHLERVEHVHLRSSNSEASPSDDFEQVF